MTVRKSLPYQGIARRAIGSDNTPPTYDTEIDVSTVLLKDGELDDSDLVGKTTPKSLDDLTPQEEEEAIYNAFAGILMNIFKEKKNEQK